MSLFAARCLSRVARCSVFVACCCVLLGGWCLVIVACGLSLFEVRCLRFVVWVFGDRCSLRVAWCLFVCCLRVVGCCMLFVNCRVLFAVCCV